MNTKTYKDALISIYVHPNRIKMDQCNANLARAQEPTAHITLVRLGHLAAWSVAESGGRGNSCCRVHGISHFQYIGVR
jgi:hypothetical protein